MTAHKLPLFTVFAALLAGAACSAGGASAPGGVGGAPTSGAPAASMGGCPQENLTQACTCGALGGSQVCQSGVWSACDCLPPAGTAPASLDAGGIPSGPVTPLSFPGNDRTDITFAWQSTPAPIADGTCPPGEYEGNFQGIYYSILAPGGLGVPVTNIDVPGQPSGFHFMLSPAAGGEVTQAVKGAMDGTADDLFPFKADITGELNCRTGTFTGTMTNGSYSILTPGLLPQSFEGVLSSHYDKRTHTFIDGAWDVKETTATPPGTLAPTLPRDFKRDGFGGSGQFAAASATNVTDPTLTACPTNYTCGPGLFGPNKFLCNTPIGTPTCVTDADCAPQFPGENVPCLKASLFSLCLRECKP